MCDDIDGHLFHHLAVRRFVLEGSPKRAGFQRRDDFLRNAAGEEDAAAALEHQRQVAGCPAQAGDEQVQRFLSRRVRCLEGRFGDFGGSGEARRLSVGQRHGAIDVDQSAPAQDLLA